MARLPRTAWDSSAFNSLLKKDKDAKTEDPECRKALKIAYRQMLDGERNILASTLIEIEVRPENFRGDIETAAEFHNELKACPNFQSYNESRFIQKEARTLADRVQLLTLRRGTYADLMHVATAIAAGAAELWTLDTQMLSWYESATVTEIKICKPYILQQPLALDW